MKKTFGTALVYGAWLASHSAQAAPCCGGASSVPSLIAGDDRAQLSLLLSQGAVIGDAPVEGPPVFRAPSDSETTETLRLDGAVRVTGLVGPLERIFGDRLQFGGGIPLIRRNREVSGSGTFAQGLGDIQLDAAYEILPEWSYSVWRPHGFFFIDTTLPTGTSVYDASSLYLLDARGRGFFSLGAGGVLLKAVGNWDGLMSLEVHRSFTRAFPSDDGSTLELSPGFGLSAALIAGYSPGGGALHLGLGVSPIFEQGIESEGAVSSMSDAQLVWNVSATAGYAITSEWSASLSYVDQTLLGPARNVSLSRTFAVSVQRREAL